MSNTIITARVEGRLIDIKEAFIWKLAFIRSFTVCLRIDEEKAMSPGISGGKQVIKFANRRNRGRVCLFSQTSPRF